MTVTAISRRELFVRTYAAVSSRPLPRRQVGRPSRPAVERPAWRGAWPRGTGWFAGGRPGAGRLSGRGGVLVVFVACFSGLLVADWANWAELAGAVFFMAGSLTAYYVRRSGLLPMVVSPPLLFSAACVIEKLLTSAEPLAALSGTVAALANSAGWLLAGTGLTTVIAVLRGLRSEVRVLVLALRSSLPASFTCEARAGAGTTSAP